jgi:ketosteroid isomerase-like protein
LVLLDDGVAELAGADETRGVGAGPGRETSIKVVGGFATSIPDLKFQIHEILVAGDRVIVRGEVTGTPSGALFGAPHTGKSFRIMAIDIQTIRDGRISKTYHLENWLSALGQLRAQ